MPSLFRKRKEPYSLRSRKNAQSTPKSKVDACVECDLPFDESKITPELRRQQIPGIEKSSRVSEAHPENADRLNKTNLEPVDISVEPSHEESTSSSDPPPEFQRVPWSREKVSLGLERQDISDPEDFCNETYSEKGKEKELAEENTDY